MHKLLLNLILAATAACVPAFALSCTSGFTEIASTALNPDGSPFNGTMALSLGYSTSVAQASVRANSVTLAVRNGVVDVCLASGYYTDSNTPSGGTAYLTYWTIPSFGGPYTIQTVETPQPRVLNFNASQINPCPQGQMLGTTFIAAVTSCIAPVGVPVTSFGADPTGVKDSTAAIQACANSFPSTGLSPVVSGTGGQCILPTGIYNIGAINLPVGVSLVPEGAAAPVTFNCTLTTNLSMAQFCITANGYQTLNGITFTAPSQQFGVGFINIPNQGAVTIENSWFFNFYIAITVGTEDDSGCPIGVHLDHNGFNPLVSGYNLSGSGAMLLNCMNSGTVIGNVMATNTCFAGTGCANPAFGMWLFDGSNLLIEGNNITSFGTGLHISTRNLLSDVQSIGDTYDSSGYVCRGGTTTCTSTSPGFGAVRIDNSAGQILNTRLIGDSFTASTAGGLSIAPTGGLISALEISSPIAEGNAGDGIAINGTLGARIVNWSVKGGQYLANGGNGITIAGTSEGTVSDITTGTQYYPVSATATGSASSGSTALTVSGITGTIAQNSIVTGTGIQDSTSVSGSGSSWTMSRPSSGPVSGTVSFWPVNAGYGIAISGNADYLNLHDNQLVPNTAGALSNTSTGTHNLIHDNRGYNPAGASSITSQCASLPCTVPSTPSPSPAILYMAGGTVTGVTRGGVTICPTDCTVTLPPNGQATISGTSGAPPTTLALDIQ